MVFKGWCLGQAATQQTWWAWACCQGSGALAVLGAPVLRPRGWGQPFTQQQCWGWVCKCVRAAVLAAAVSGAEVLAAVLHAAAV